MLGLYWTWLLNNMKNVKTGLNSSLTFHQTSSDLVRSNIFAIFIFNIKIYTWFFLNPLSAHTVCLSGFKPWKINISHSKDQKLMLGIFSKAFPKGEFLSDNFPSGNFPNVQFLKRQLPIGYVRPPSEARGLSDAARTSLASYCLVNCTVGKLPLGKIPLWKSLWEST